MKRMALLLIVVLLLQSIAASALSASDAKSDWLESKEVSKEKREAHQDAKIAFAGDKSEENREAVVETGKESLHAALDEAEAWLVWKNIEAEDNPLVPDEIKESVKEDVEKNLDKIDALREDVDGVSNQLELGLVFLKMIGKYGELLTDVARNTGAMWVHIGNTYLDTAEEYEEKLRDSAGDDDEVLERLDEAKESLEEARENVDKAEDSYEDVVLPGTPLIKFAEGNNYLRVARTNLLSAHRNMNQALQMMLRGD